MNADNRGAFKNLVRELGSLCWATNKMDEYNEIKSKWS